MKRILFFAIATIIALQSAFADEGLHWPKEFDHDNYTITLYQPQYDAYEHNVLEGRMALSVKAKDKEPVFGALWFKARLETDKEARTASLVSIIISKVYFPGVEDSAKIESFSALVSKEIESWNIVMSLDRLTAGLKDIENLNALSEDLNNNPPDIYFRTEPAVLISIDGDPIFKKIDGANFQYVANTQFFIVKDSKGKYFINGGKFWYSSKNATSGYSETKSVPSDIKKFAEDNIEQTEPDSISKSLTEAPGLIVVTKPSELISTDGEPNYSPIEGTTLLFVSNTSDDVIMDVDTQKHYILIAGRWYYSKTLNDGDWKFSEPKDLPPEFSKIPEDSDMAEVRSSIPGTPEAEIALLEQSVPQTASVDRKNTTVEVQWDGDPKFEKIEGTDISVGKNTDKTVLLISKKYYCVDDAIWFVSNSPQGPWTVSDVRPAEVDQIPPESEAYNVKYVYIYETTPEVVYVGYLPGYTYSYVYGGCVVYGTGYYYRPWYGHYYYPRPVTFGFGVHYNPWTGWGFSVGFRFGWIGWGFHPYHRAYWGPRGFHAGYRHGYYHGYRRGYARGARAGYYAGSRNSNVYRNRPTGVRTANKTRPATSDRNLNRKTRPSTKPNNVYTDRKGNVYQRDKNGNWNNKSRPAQRPANNPNTRPQQKPSTRPATTRPATTKPAQKPSTKPAQRPSTRPANQQRPSNRMSNQQRQNMNRSYQNRSRGTQNYNRSRSMNRSGGASRGGMSRGGGGRRR